MARSAKEDRRWALVVRPSASDQLKALPQAVAGRIVARLERIAADPFGRHPNVTAMQGEAAAYRLRQGD